MPVTTNYGWAVPTLGGDTGVWDTILNTAFDDIDADLKTVDDRVAALEAAVASGDFLLAAGQGVEAFISAIGNAPLTHWSFVGAGERNFNPSTSVTAHRLYFRLPSLPVGGTIDAFRSYGSQSSQTVDVALVRVAQDGTETVVNAGHSLPGATAETETSGVAHTILADTDYFIRLLPASPSTGSATIHSVGYTISPA
jgi:hypothetical protein